MDLIKIKKKFDTLEKTLKVTSLRRSDITILNQ